jgi:hypothetical protein
MKPIVSNLHTQNQPPSQDHSLVFRRLSVVYGHLIPGGTDILIDLVASALDGRIQGQLDTTILSCGPTMG